jgi:hypothetical protein
VITKVELIYDWLVSFVVEDDDGSPYFIEVLKDIGGATLLIYDTVGYATKRYSRGL